MAGASSRSAASFSWRACAASRRPKRSANSVASIAWMKVSSVCENSQASRIVSSPCATAAVTASIAARRSAALCSGGSAKCTGRSRRGPMMRLRQNRAMTPSPPLASSIAPRNSGRVSQSSISSAIIVARLRVPGRLPAGLPD